MGTQLPFPKKGDSPPQFSVHVYCGQTAVYQNTTWYVGSLSLGDIVFDGNQLPLP